MTKKAFIYCRISQDRSKEGLGVARQEADCRALADSLGVEVVEVFTDNDMSASNGRKRPGYESMLMRLAEVDTILCWHNDRLTRKMVELVPFIELVEAHSITIQTVSAGEYDLRTSTGKMIAHIMGSVAQKEADQMAERMKRKRVELASKSRYMGGPRPFGWNPKGSDWDLNVREAEALAKASYAILEGSSLRAICTDWNDPEREGGALLSTFGNDWHANSLKRTLMRPRNAGFFVVKDQVMSDDVVPPIVSEEVWRAVCTVLDNPKRRTSMTRVAKHLLSGIAQCSCGQITQPGKIKDGKNPETPKAPIYKCRDIGKKGTGSHVAKRMERMDHMAEVWVWRMLMNGAGNESKSPELGAKVAELKAELANLATREAEAGDAVATGLMTFQQLQAFNQSLKAQREALESELGNIGTHVVRAGMMVDSAETRQVADDRFREWLNLPVDDRRAFISANFHVVMLKGKSGCKFNPETVSFVPRSPADLGARFDAEQLAALEHVPFAETPAAGLEILERWRAYREGGGFDRSLATAKYLNTMREHAMSN
ncbi:recombinase family protein [Arthrobacter sp. MYb227]|uniref:recombinase family protein n=1 Tax=Arthrobacter sp. MYb227 TaxID=1848601 RepID=UPI0015E30FB0|nr:recombinase family protein [Arthrobacter sp. MYb227]